MENGSEAGERVLADATKKAQSLWGARLIAAYAIGSLAHGGFAPHVSDVDVGFVLEGSLTPSDADAIAQLTSEIKNSGAPLADRLSVFWGSFDTLSGKASGGRFPPVDLIDLKQFGRLLAGQDVRDTVRVPTVQELTVASAAFALRSPLLCGAVDYLDDAASLAGAGLKKLTKTVLYPVRFLYTARTGQTGMNHKAIEHFLSNETGAAAVLARAAFDWRVQPPAAGDAGVIRALQDGLRPLYRIFIKDYERRLKGYGEAELVAAYAAWRHRIG
jgi:hypothetical protein